MALLNALLNGLAVLGPKRHGGCLPALLFAGALGTSVQATELRDYEVKAVFLFNFAQFVDWPQSAFPEAQSPLVIGILGRDPFGAFLDDTVRGETVEGRPLVVRRYSRVEEIRIATYSS